MVLDFATEAIKKTESHSINFDELRAGKANIKVIGAGGCGGNAVTWLFNKGINGATIYAANTDALHLSVTKADEKLLIGKELTKGLGAGSIPKIGEDAAKESEAELKKSMQGADMIFITCGLGGGTGTGSAPVIADVAKTVNTGGIAQYTAQGPDISPTSYNNATTLGKLRITRVSGSLKVFVWENSQWEWNGNTSGIETENSNNNNLLISLFMILANFE